MVFTVTNADLSDISREFDVLTAWRKTQQYFVSLLSQDLFSDHIVTIDT